MATIPEGIFHWYINGASTVTQICVPVNGQSYWSLLLNYEKKTIIDSKYKENKTYFNLIPVSLRKELGLGFLYRSQNQREIRVGQGNCEELLLRRRIEGGGFGAIGSDQADT